MWNNWTKNILICCFVFSLLCGFDCFLWLWTRAFQSHLLSRFSFLSVIILWFWCCNTYHSQFTKSSCSMQNIVGKSDNHQLTFFTFWYCCLNSCLFIFFYTVKKAFTSGRFLVLAVFEYFEWIGPTLWWAQWKRFTLFYWFLVQ